MISGFFKRNSVPYEMSEEEKRKQQQNLEETRKNHELADELKLLSSQANKMMTADVGVEVGNGWRKVESSPKSRSNFKAVLYEKNGQYALCYVGTDKFELNNISGFAKDWGANLKMGITGNSRQIDEAKKFAEDMKAKYNLNSKNTLSVGHSEGGTEATHVGLNNGFKTYTFNGYGVHKSKLPENADYSLVTNYRDPHDPVSKIHANVGNTYITPNTQSKFMSKTPFGSIEAHSIDKQGSCVDSVPVEEYKKKHPLFLNKLSEAEMTGEDIGLMDSKLFALYEPEINNRLKQKQIFPSSYLANRNTPYVKGLNGSRGYYKRFV